MLGTGSKTNAVVLLHVVLFLHKPKIFLMMLIYSIVVSMEMDVVLI